MKIRPISATLQEVASIELNEVERKIENELAALEHWLAKQKHLKYKKNDQFLVNMLRISKYRQQDARRRLDGYYTFRTLAPEIAQNLDPLLPELQAFLKIGMCLPLPTSKEDPTRVFLLRFGNYDPEQVTQITMMKAGYMISETLLNEDDYYVIGGIKAICDMKGVQFKTALQITPSLFKKAFFCYENGFHARFKAAYFVNVPGFYQHAVNGFKGLLGKKLAERIHFYSNDNWEDVYNDVPKSILPLEYGGEAGTIKELASFWKETVEKRREVLMKEDDYRSIESEREKADPIGEDFGVRGSFKKLEID